MNVFTKTLLLLLAMIPTATAYTENFESFDEGDIINEIPASNYELSIDVVRRGCSEKALIMDTSSPTGTSLHQPQHGKVLVLSPDGESPNPCEDGGVLKFKFSPGSYVSSIGLLGMDERVRILVFPDTPGKQQVVLLHVLGVHLSLVTTLCSDSHAAAVTHKAMLHVLLLFINYARLVFFPFFCRDDCRSRNTSSHDAVATRSRSRLDIHSESLRVLTTFWVSAATPHLSRSIKWNSKSSDDDDTSVGCTNI